MHSDAEKGAWTVKRQWLTPLSILTVLLIVITAFVTPAGSTLAKWYEELKGNAVPATTDRYTLSFAEAADNSENSDPAKPPVWNSPGFTVKNNSTTLARQMRIARTQLTSRYTYSDSAVDPIRNSKVVFALAPAGQTCTSSTREAVWTAKEAGQAPAPSYTPAAGQGTFTLKPGETRQMCLDITPGSGSSTVDQRRALLRSFAGAGIKARTDVESAQKLSTNGTENSAITNLYRVGLPRPVIDTSITSAKGTPGCKLGEVTDIHGYMKLQWAWPDSAGNSETTTPVVDHWELWNRATPEDPWSKVTDGDYLRAGDWTNAPQHIRGNIPADKREVFLDRGWIRNVTLFAKEVHKEFVIVGVLKNSENTRFVATKMWDLSWNGHASPLFSQYYCNSATDTPAAVTGEPNVPGKEW